ncbi:MULTISPECIES: N-acetyltransferase [Sphingopyxis]|uniref:N-acetyltransferase n=1 Tax=Sphingopyxis TaxID=165697 RepID=UPI0016445754|nr:MULTISPECIES: N-acetyltransferase [Sphingopyxis]QXF13148.1 N-acetyltransferase [Sphingopyxis terrae subsp. terrae]
MAAHSQGPVSIHPVKDKAHKREFVELAFRLNRGDPAWVPPLKNEAFDLLTPGKNPWFEHGKAQLFLARRDGRTVGRISAHVDFLALEQPASQGMGPGTGNWGLLEAEDAEVAHALIVSAEDWLRGQGMNRALGPLSISIWDEPGLLVEGFDTPPTIMLGHNSPLYQGWIEAEGYRPVKKLFNYAVDIVDGFPPLVNRIVAAGEKNERIRIRRVDKRKFDAEAQLIMGILNDAWSDNWGFVPLTDSEIAYVGKKLKDIVFEDLIRVAEVDGEAVAFMIVLPDINELLIGMDGSLFPFNWARLLWWLRKPKSKRLRVPLMGVVKKLQNSRMASTLAFMMIEYIRRDGVAKYGAEQGDIGWVLDDNQGMNAVADAINATVNRVYQLYDKPLS